MFADELVTAAWRACATDGGDFIRLTAFPYIYEFKV
jgi:hypothetical protein